MKVLIFLLLLTTACFAESAERSLEYDSRFFIVEYQYETQWAMIPATSSPGAPHYSAQITVYEIKNGKKIELFKTSGTYVEGGCFEDDPKIYIKKAIDEHDRDGG